MSGAVTVAELASRHGLKRIGREWRGNCPACGYRHGLSIAENSGRPLWWCANCRDQSAVGKALMGDAMPAGSFTSNPPPPPEDRSAVVRAMVDLARPSPIIPNYLNSRGLRMPPSAPLLYLPNAKHPCGRTLPCMLALLHDLAGELVAAHCTFLAPGGAGKAPVEPQRMTLGNVRGAAVRLYPVAPHLVVAEGIETALAAAEMLGLPAWAATSAGNLGDALALPPEVQTVTIATDNDPPGRRAARDAAARWRAEGRTVQMALPECEGDDFADVLRRVRGAA
jgi:putative DNA primase/helicase